MTPQANLPPAFPVLKDSSFPPKPKSSLPSCTTKARPKILVSPRREIMLSTMEMFAVPLVSATILPKSPTCLISAVMSP